MEDKNMKGNESQGDKKLSGFQKWQKKKLEKVNRDDIDVISHKTRDQNDFIFMLNILDNALYELRMKMGWSKDISFDKALDLFDRSLKIKEEINLLNAEMCQLIGWDYSPPRGFPHPLGEGGEKKKGKKGAAKAHVEEKLPESANSMD